MTDWSRYQACPVCPAELGKACLSLTGMTARGQIAIEAANPHGGRKLRAASTRKGDS